MKIPFGKPLIDKKEKNAVQKVISKPILVHGPKTLEFEKNFSSFTNAPYALSVSSCTAGMHLIYFTLGISKGDEVIVPAQTHTATAHAAALTGAKTVFVDCELSTGNIQINKIEKQITKRTKAISVVHFIGIAIEMSKIVALAKKYKLYIIEDCAIALGSKFKKKHVGLLGDAGIFSFYPVKHMTTAEGGMIILKNKKLFNKIKINRALGINKNFNERKIPGLYDAVNLGFNYRMSEIHAAIGVEQLKKLPTFLKKREINFNFLFNRLKNLNDIKILSSNNKDCQNSFYCLTIVLMKNIARFRNKIIMKLKNKGIGTSVYYPQPVPRMTYYKKKYGYKSDNFKNAETISDFSIALPVAPHLTTKHMNYIFKNLKATIIKIKNERN
jgi:dTDP-4-amino-4,6-dideoxygalactose transaminase